MGSRLKSIASTAALFFPVKEHLVIIKAYHESDLGIEDFPEFKKIQKYLRSLKHVNNLKEDIYTYILEGSATERKMIFMEMASKETYLGNSMPASEFGKKVYGQKKSYGTKIYEDEEGEWISGMAPIKGPTGKILGVLEINHHIHRELAGFKSEILEEILKGFFLAFIVSIVIALLVGHSLSTPLRKLIQGVKDYTAGDADVNVKVSTKDEIGILSEKFNEMVVQVNQSQNQMIQNEKLVGLGNMAAGIAHEINNPVAIILNYAELIEKNLNKDEVPIAKIKANTMKIKKGCVRIQKIVTGMLHFSREASADDFARSSIREIINEAVELTEYKARMNDVKVTVSPAKDIWIECQSIPISQVFVNLISNAIDATSEEEAPWVQLDIYEHEKFVVFTVTDSGHGISPDIQSKVLDPFFTTKKVGKGTGLGLSVSQSIIKKHHGLFFVDNNFKNTRFVIKLPKSIEYTALVDEKKIA